jgi:hypothetical protein
MAVALVEARDGRFQAAKASEISPSAEWPENRLAFEVLAEGLVAALPSPGRPWR